MAIQSIGLFAVTESASKKIALKAGGKIKAHAGTKYLLQVDNETVAPQNVTVKRVGKDLLLSFEGSDKPDLTIQDFFAEGMDGQLYGVSEDGMLYAYVRTDGEGFGGPLLLADGESAPIALGGDGVVYQPAATTDDAAGFALWPLLLGLAGIGAAAAAIIHHNKDSGGHHTKTSPVPTDSKAMDDVGPIQGQLHNGDITDDSHPAISGNGVPGAVIHVFDNGQEIGSTTVNPDGTWSFTPELADGSHSLDVTQEVPGEKPSGHVPVVDIVVDTTPPAAPTAEIEGAKSEDGNTYSPDNTPIIHGTGEPGDTIIIVYPTGETASTVVGPDGQWVAPEPTQPLPEGNNDIKVIEQDPAGNQTEIVIPVIIDTIAPVAPEVHLDPASDTGIKGDDITSDTKPTIDGKTEPGAEITATFPTGEVMTTTADANGDWSVTPTQPLPEGNNDIVVVATDPAGNQSEPTVIAVVVDTTAPTAPEAHLDPASDSGEKGDGITNDTTPTIDGKTEPGAEITVTFPTGEVMTTTADANGDWSVTPTQPLPEGNNDITVIATDPAGNQSEPTVIAVVIDTTAPTAPDAWLDPASDSGVKGDDITNDNTPTIDGKTEPGADITVTFPTGEVIHTTADDHGDWSVTPTQPLPEGDNTITVVATDPAGNASELAHQQQALEISDRYVARMRELVDMLSKIAQVDPGRASEAVQARSRLLQAETARDTVESKLQEVKTTLAKLVGEDVTVPGDAKWDWKPIPMDEALAQLSDTPAIRQARYEKEAALANADSVKSSRMPKLNWVVGRSAGGNNMLNNDEPWSTGLAVEWTAFTGGSASAAQRAAYSRASAAEQKMEATRRESEYTIRNLAQQRDLSASRVNDYKQLLSESDKVRKMFYDQWYHLGKRTLLDVLIAENEYYSHQLEASDTYYNAVTSDLRIRAETAGLMAWLAPGSEASSH
ncbi:Ig-like domain-containing protein [Enterobacterales bacterium AE_CKDN230030158-1A_HGKHYDSX7]